jgi:hypothetical protein
MDQAQCSIPNTQGAFSFNIPWNQPQNTRNRMQTLNTITARALRNNTPGKIIITPLIGLFQFYHTSKLIAIGFTLLGVALAS